MKHLHTIAFLLLREIYSHYFYFLHWKHYEVDKPTFHNEVMSDPLSIILCSLFLQIQCIIQIISDLKYQNNLCPLPNHPAPSRSSCVGPSAAWRRASSPPPPPSRPPPGREDLGTGWSFCWSPKRGARSIQESERVWICDLRSKILRSRI